MATTIVTANCRKKTPDGPPMNASGTNTDDITKVIATIAPPICPIASSVASRTDIRVCSSFA
jgi:hypothetical protein